MEKSSFPFNQKIAWKPNPEWIAQSNLQRFIRQNNLQDYDHLTRKSTTDIEWFWDAAIKDLYIEFYKPYSKVVDLSKGPAFPKWCVGGKMNISHNCLDKWQNTPRKNQTALIFESEDGLVLKYTYEELCKAVNRCANALRKSGFKKGNIAGLFMPMVPEIAIAFLAIIKVGGVILPLFSGYGPAAIETRLKDSGAKYLFTADGFFRRQKWIDMKTITFESVKNCSSIKNVIVLNRSGKKIEKLSQKEINWHDFISGHSLEAETEKTSAEDMCMLIYTSGTTGKPKGAVHTHCGFPVKAAQDMYHCMDLKPGEVMYWMSDMGWMMGPWEVFGSLLIGATMVFYDGAPDFPDFNRLWRMVETHKITHLGVSPTLIRTVKEKG